LARACIAAGEAAAGVGEMPQACGRGGDAAVAEFGGEAELRLVVRPLRARARGCVAAAGEGSWARGGRRLLRGRRVRARGRAFHGGCCGRAAVSRRRLGARGRATGVAGVRVRWYERGQSTLPLNG
jgi:hypothetical protein